MVNETIIQNWIFKEFILPFLLIFAVVFAVLEKTKIFGEDKKQLNAIVAFVVGLIFVGVAYPKQVVGNMILFLTVSLIIVLVFLMLYGFVASDLKDGYKAEGWMKWAFLIIISVAVIGAVIWATGFKSEFFDILFGQSWSTSFWTNFLFVVVIVVAVAVVLKGAAKKE
ncbi:MAG: hypothetical protein KKA64_01925 [Nanoarchaeota archaeon]|nr:hypothetical protein [Nanoarchaeota archaeon]